jgi:hypothetical protein
VQFRNANQRNSWQSRDCRAAATILVASTWETLIAGAAVGSKPGRAARLASGFRSQAALGKRCHDGVGGSRAVLQ